MAARKTAKKWTLVSRSDVTLDAQELLEAVIGIDASDSVRKVMDPEVFLANCDMKKLQAELEKGNNYYLDDILYDNTPTFELIEN